MARYLKNYQYYHNLKICLVNFIVFRLAYIGKLIFSNSIKHLFLLKDQKYNFKKYVFLK